MNSNPEESFKPKTNKHTVSGYSYLHSIYILSTEVKFYEDLKEHLIEITNCEKKRKTCLSQRKRKNHKRNKNSIIR